MPSATQSLPPVAGFEVELAADSAVVQVAGASSPEMFPKLPLNPDRMVAASADRKFALSEDRRSDPIGLRLPGLRTAVQPRARSSTR